MAKKEHRHPSSPPKVEIIGGRRVKVAGEEQVKKTSERLMVKYSRSLDILKNR